MCATSLASPPFQLKHSLLGGRIHCGRLAINQEHPAMDRVDICSSTLTCVPECPAPFSVSNTPQQLKTRVCADTSLTPSSPLIVASGAHSHALKPSLQQGQRTCQASKHRAPGALVTGFQKACQGLDAALSRIRSSLAVWLCPHNTVPVARLRLDT